MAWLKSHLSVCFHTQQRLYGPQSITYWLPKPLKKKSLPTSGWDNCCIYRGISNIAHLFYTWYKEQTSDWAEGPFHCYQTKLRPTHTCSKADLVTLGCDEGKSSVYCRRQARSLGQLMLKRPQLPEGFQGKAFKHRWRESVEGYATSLWTYFWLAGSEVIRNQHQPSGSSRSGVYLLVGSTQLPSSTWWGLQHLQNISKDRTKNMIYSLWGGAKDPWFV